MLWIIVLAIVVVVWFTCGIVNYGYTFAYFQRKYLTIATASYKGDRNMARWFILAGIPGLFGSYAVSGNEFFKYGFKWR